MFARLGFMLSGLREKLWVGPAINASLSLLAYGAALWSDRFALPVPYIKLETVESLLSVMAGSLLAVATFAVGSMVSAYAFASSNGTPRAFRLVVSDDASSRALSVFVGAYVFSMLGLIVVQTVEPGPAATFVMFALVVGVIARVILTFVGWVDSIARLGRLGDTIARLELAARKALTTLGADGRNGAAAPPGDPPPGAWVLRHDPGNPDKIVGHVQYIDLSAIQAWAGRARMRVWLEITPGAFVTRDAVLARIAGDAEDCDLDDAARMMQRALVIGTERSFAEDPCYGLLALSEIASRALSPGINDPGTAMQVIERLTGLILYWDGLESTEDGPRFPNVYLPALTPERALEDAFALIEADGADSVKIATALQRAYATIAGTGEPLSQAARARAMDARARAEAVLGHAPDIDRVRAAAPPHP